MVHSYENAQNDFSELLDYSPLGQSLVIAIKVISYEILLDPLVTEFAATRNQLCNTLVFEDYRTVIALAPSE